jgi:hypothetical protein
MSFTKQQIINKNGIKFVKLGKNKFNLTFDWSNTNILLPSIINFDLIQLINKLNPTIFEHLIINNISNLLANDEEEINVNILLNDIFADLGLPHYFLALNVKKMIIDSNKISFYCSSFDNKLETYPDDVELIPIQKFDIHFDIIQNHNIKINCDIDLTDNHNIPSFSEKMIGNIIYNIFNRLKQFIEKVSF